MNDFCITLSLDDAFDCYEMSKRQVSKVPLFYYDPVKNEFVKIKGSKKFMGYIFINSHELCTKLIDEYLSQPEMKEYKKSFEKTADNTRNRIVDFLWFFEHIDGCRGFNNYEILRVTGELRKWCKKHGLDYLEPEVYRIK